MVFSKLSGRISERLHHLSDGGIFGAQSEIGSRQSNLRQTRPYRRLSGDECCTSGGTTLLAIPVGKKCALFGNAIDIRCAVPHDAKVVCADVVPADVVAHDE